MSLSTNGSVAVTDSHYGTSTTFASDGNGVGGFYQLILQVGRRAHLRVRVGLVGAGSAGDADAPRALMHLLP